MRKLEFLMYRLTYFSCCANATDRTSVASPVYGKKNTSIEVTLCLYID